MYILSIVQPLSAANKLGKWFLNLNEFSVLQVIHEAGIEPGVECGEQLSDRQPVSRLRPPSSLPVLHLLRFPSQTPLLWPPVLRALHRPYRQHGLRGHRGSVWLSLSCMQIPAPPQRLRLFATREPETADWGVRCLAGLNICIVNRALFSLGHCWDNVSDMEPPSVTHECLKCNHSAVLNMQQGTCEWAKLERNLHSLVWVVRPVIISCKTLIAVKRLHFFIHYHCSQSEQNLNIHQKGVT